MSVEKLEDHQHTSGTTTEFGTLGVVGYFEPHGILSYSLKLTLQFHRDSSQINFHLFHSMCILILVVPHSKLDFCHFVSLGAEISPTQVAAPLFITYCNVAWKVKIEKTRLQKELITGVFLSTELNKRGQFLNRTYHKILVENKKYPLCVKS
jgi:hypothetical protein